jgi:hypothetical protein
MLYSAKQVPLNEAKLKTYLATPMVVKNGIFFAKIYVHSNHSLQEYKRHTEFTQYLKAENIIMDINDLDDINPTQLGFLEESMAKYENLETTTLRL